MTFRKLAPFLSLSTLSLGLLFMAPSTAQAAEVMCSSNFGECTVSNDGQSFISCTCGEGGGDEGTGGDELLGLSEEELQVVCLEHLAWCEPQGDGDGDMETGTSTGDPTDGGTTDGGTTDGGTTDEGTTDLSTTSDTAEGSTSDTADSSTCDTADSSTGDTADSSTGDTSDGSTGDTAEGTTGDPGSDSGEGSGSDSGGGQSESGDGASETGTGGDSGGAEGQAEGGGCNVSPNASGFGLLMLSMLGLLGLRRREEN